jgi:NADH dehydrogenase FAD-containing subunit
VPKAVIKEVDPFNKKIKTAVGDFSFDHSILMAPHQAGDMAWKAGVIGKNAEGKPTGWAGVDPFFLNLKDDPDVYVIGDAVGVVSPQFLFYPKPATSPTRTPRLSPNTSANGSRAANPSTRCRTTCAS